jgi:hypothetical protein
VYLGCSNELGKTSAVHKKVAASSVVLVFAAHCALGLHGSGPIPHPIGCESFADRGVRGNEQVTLTPLFELGSWLSRNMIAVAHLSVDRDWRLVELVASAVIVVLGRHEPTLPVATFAIRRPREDVDESLGCIRLIGTKDVDCAATCRLASGDVRLCDVSVLQVFYSYKSSGSD